MGGDCKTDGELKEGSQAGGVAQWWSNCLVCAKPWVPFPASQKRNKKQRKGLTEAIDNI
jgi:hypothetical protein